MNKDKEGQKFKTMICGSRCYPDLKQVEEYLKCIPKDSVKIIHGGAIGVDKHVEEVASKLGIETEVYKPIKKEMIGASDFVVAFWDEESKGTKFVIDYVKHRGREMFVFTPGKSMPLSVNVKDYND